MALEWQREQSLLCSCGHPIDETTVADEAPAWIAEPIVCNACAARERRSKADNDGESRPAPGTKYRTRNRLHDP